MEPRSTSTWNPVKISLRTFLPHFAATLVVGILALMGGFYLAAENDVQAAPGLSNASAVAATTGVPGQIHYQGTLRDLDGNLINGVHALTFNIYDGSIDEATSLWAETHVSVTVRSGYFSVLLGDVTTLPQSTFDQPDRYIGVTIDQFDELIPRQRFASVPYAMRANHAITAENAFSADNGVPAGGLVFFGDSNATGCPTGWREAIALHGRYIVGSPADQVHTHVGESLSSGENRSVGQHDHNVVDNGHTHGITDPKHSHSINDPGHDHDIDVDDGGGENGIDDAGHSTEDNERNSQDIYPSTTGITINSASTGIEVNSHTADVTIAPSGSTLGTNAPYYQLLPCIKL